MNLTTAANRGSLASHQMAVCKKSMNDTESRKRNFQAETPLGTWAIRNTLDPTGLPLGTNGKANGGNVVLKG